MRWLPCASRCRLLEIAGYDRGYFVRDPTGGESIELVLANQNSIDYQGIPCDAATRCLFRVPVVVSVAQAAGTSRAVARDAVGLDTDDKGTGVQWSETLVHLPDARTARCSEAHPAHGGQQPQLAIDVSPSRTGPACQPHFAVRKMPRGVSALPPG